MPEQSRQSIRAMVTECLARCYRADAPLAALASTVEELRSQRWPEGDIRKVERIVRRMLAGIVSRATDDDPLDSFSDSAGVSP